MTKSKTAAGVERLLAERLTPTINEFALAFAHEPPERVEKVLEDMRAGVAKDMTAIFSPQKGKDIADAWIKIIKARIAEVSAVQPGAA